MPAPTRKACANCVRSKRKCDLNSPACDRCLRRNIPCDYSEADRAIQRHGRRSSAQLSEASQQPTFILQNATTTSNASSDAMDTTPHTMPPDESPPTSVDTAPPPSGSGAGADNDDGGGGLYPRDLDHMNLIGEPESCGDIVVDDDFIVGGSYCHARVDFAQRQLRGWLATLATHGQCAFINMRLYEEHDMPLLDTAFAAAAAYEAQTPQTVALVQRLVRRSVQGLKADVARTQAEGRWGCEIQVLAATQALLVYQLIRLFDGDIRLRAEGEADEALLFEWAEALRAHATPVARPWEAFRPSGIPLRETMERLNGWLGWLVDESVRRTVLTAWALLGTYASLKFGFQRIWGRTRQLGFCAQGALWDAGSAYAWWKVSQEARLLKVSIRNWDEDMEAAEPEDLEDMGLLFMASIKGLDATCRWLGEEHMKRLGVDWSENVTISWRVKP